MMLDYACISNDGQALCFMHVQVLLVHAQIESLICIKLNLIGTHCLELNNKGANYYAAV